jgi:hypothetical protein
VSNNLFHSFIFKIFILSVANRVEDLPPLIYVIIAFTLSSGNMTDRASQTPALREVIAAKKLGISQSFPLWGTTLK